MLSSIWAQVPPDQCFAGVFRPQPMLSPLEKEKKSTPPPQLERFLYTPPPPSGTNRRKDAKEFTKMKAIRKMIKRDFNVVKKSIVFIQFCLQNLGQKIKGRNKRGQEGEKRRLRRVRRSGGCKEKIKGSKKYSSLKGSREEVAWGGGV